MLEKLNEIAKALRETGGYEGIQVIDEIWHDGGGAPVYLDDVIKCLEQLASENRLDLSVSDQLALQKIQGTWPPDDLRRAFVAGATWWEFESTNGTMWNSDRQKAEKAAEFKYPGGQCRPTLNLTTGEIKL